MRLEDGFVAWADRDPGLPAVVSGDDRRSYGQLFQQASELAEDIAAVIDPTGARIGLFTERGPDAYTAILAILLAGAAYVPVNPGHPPARIARTIELADLDLILADETGLSGLGRLEPRIDLPPILAPWSDVGGLGITGSGRAREQRDRDRDETLAYLLFTSGTTGDPKGVPISHQNVTAFLAANLDHYQFGPGDRCSQTFDLTFDLSVFDLFMALGSGACLYPLSSTDLLSPVDAVAERGLSIWFSVPAVAALQRQRGALRPGVMPSLRASLFCGEALSVEVANAWSEAAPNSIGENLYGPTELTIACTRHRFSSIDRQSDRQLSPGGLVPIGRPFPGLDIAIVGLDGAPVAPGQEGELCVTGPQRFAGYWRSPEKTADRTITIDGADFYRTGDRVVDDDSTLNFVGRSDDQVQILGHRVELGEVEAGARSVDDVVDAVAVALPYGEPVATEVGLMATIASTSTLDHRQLRRAVAKIVPSSMAPRKVVVLDRFPLNANGKIDRSAAARMAFCDADGLLDRAGS